MQVSNSTGQSTTYRVTGGGGGAIATDDPLTFGRSGGTATLEVEEGKLDPHQEEEHCFGDSSDWTVEFRVEERLVAARTFASAPICVSLMEEGGNYWVDAHDATTTR